MAPIDGRITSLQNLSTLAGNELFLVVSPPSPSTGINYNVSATTILQLVTSSIFPIPNSDLANSAITIGGKNYILGSTYFPLRLGTSGATTTPAATNNTSGVMMGLGVSFVASTSGELTFDVSGDLSNTGNATTTVTLNIGTGTVPTNGSAGTGTVVGNTIVSFNGTGFVIPFPISGFTSVTVGSTYWADLELKTASSSFTSNITNAFLVIVEL